MPLTQEYICLIVKQIKLFSSCLFHSIWKYINFDISSSFIIFQSFFSSVKLSLIPYTNVINSSLPNSSKLTIWNLDKYLIPTDSLLSL